MHEYSSIVNIYFLRNVSSICIIYKVNENNNEEERRSGTTGTGVSLKDLQISEKTKEEKNAKKFVEKRARSLQACSVSTVASL